MRNHEIDLKYITMKDLKIIEGCPVCDPIDKLLIHHKLSGVNHFPCGRS